MASGSISNRATSRPPWETIVAAAAVASLALWFVEIHTAFGLPAHPLIIHVPWSSCRCSRSRRWRGLQLGWFERSAAGRRVLGGHARDALGGAGEAFREDREGPPEAMDATLDHAEAGEALRFTMVVLTALLVGMLFARKLPPVVNTVLRVLAVLLALVAVFFVIRTGHLGAKLAWGREGGGAPPAGLQGGPGAGQPPGGRAESGRSVATGRRAGSGRSVAAGRLAGCGSTRPRTARSAMT